MKKLTWIRIVLAACGFALPALFAFGDGFSILSWRRFPFYVCSVAVGALLTLDQLERRRWLESLRKRQERW